MYILAIDTTGGVGAIALGRDELSLSVLTLPDNRPSESLLASIEKLLSKHNLALNEVGGYACAIGPGSFTSLRIGLSTAKALAYVHRQPIVGISSLQLMAEGVKRDNQLIVPMIPARRDAVYAVGLMANGEGWRSIIPECMYHLDEIGKLLERQSYMPHLIGEGFWRNQSFFEKALKENFIKDQQLPQRPSVEAMAKIAWQRISKGESDSLISLSPSYMQRPFAEISSLNNQ